MPYACHVTGDGCDMVVMPYACHAMGCDMVVMPYACHVTGEGCDMLCCMPVTSRARDVTWWLCRMPVTSRVRAVTCYVVCLSRRGSRSFPLNLVSKFKKTVWMAVSDGGVI